MPHEEEKLFPKELVDRALKAGDMWGWRFQDIPEVVEICPKLNYAVSGGAVIFIFPDGVGEFYWLQANAKYKQDSENWAQYVERSCSEFLGLFNALVAKVNFEKKFTSLNFL